MVDKNQQLYLQCHKFGLLYFAKSLTYLSYTLLTSNYSIVLLSLVGIELENPQQLLA